MSDRLISRYSAIPLFQLREAGLPRPHNANPTLSTYHLEYYAEYTTMDANCKLHAGIRHMWNCAKDGFPSPANLRRFLAAHDDVAASMGVELITVAAVIRRVSNGETVAETTL